MIKIGIICPSEIALRRFLPALQKASDIMQFAAISIASPKEWFGDIEHLPDNVIQEQQSREITKAKQFVNQFGGTIITGYENLISSNSIDAVYCPLPPALHYKWAKLALLHDKHVLLEKPSTTSLDDTDDLISLATTKSLALHENYMFQFHSQLKEIDAVVKSGAIGDVRLYRISFGIPRRHSTDFRYNKKLGGGALLDTGGYCMKYANYLLGGNAHLTTAQANFIDGFEVDMFGSATMTNSDGQIAQLAFGLDNDYHCDIEIWGSLGTLTSNRILTAPAGFVPTYVIKNNQDIKTIKMAEDDTFLKSIRHFYDCITNNQKREDNYKKIHTQEVLVEEFKELSGFSMR